MSRRQPQRKAKTKVSYANFHEENSLNEENLGLPFKPRGRRLLNAFKDKVHESRATQQNVSEPLGQAKAKKTKKGPAKTRKPSDQPEPEPQPGRREAQVQVKVKV